MKNKIELYCLLILLTIILLSTIFIDAHDVPHHDYLVDHTAPQTCLTCHDGALATNITPCTKSSCLLDSNSSHPIFRKYPPDGKESEYAPVFVLVAAGIKISDEGEITCLSCHDLINQEEFHLVMENWRSRLCMICHKR